MILGCGDSSDIYPYVQFYDMAKYEIKMKMLRTGEVTSMLDEGRYDPMKDLAAHSSSLKVRWQKSAGYGTSD
jgi:hypothetical protein